MHENVPFRELALLRKILRNVYRNFKLRTYLHDGSPLGLGCQLPVDLEERVLGQEDHEGLSVGLQQPVYVVQGHALVLDPVEAVEGEDLGEGPGHFVVGKLLGDVQLGEGHAGFGVVGLGVLNHLPADVNTDLKRPRKKSRVKTQLSI